MVKSRLPVLLVCLVFPFLLGGQTSLPAVERPTVPDKLTIANGTPIMLRFAQPVVGIPQNRPLNAIEHAKTGDRIRLVVATDIRIQNVVVVKKGSLAQATVARITSPDKYDESGIQLRLDWMKSVNDQEIPIRQKRKGKDSNKFIAFLFVKPGGSYLGGGLDHRTWSDTWRRVMMKETGQQWTVIPAGTRVRAYVNGDVALDSAEVAKALGGFPAQNQTATVTIFRAKGPETEQPHVVCDEKDLGALNRNQYFLLEMEAGKHSCFSSRTEKFEFSVSAGEDFYMELRKGGKWKLREMDPAVGEDTVANATPVDISGEPAQALKQP